MSPRNIGITLILLVAVVASWLLLDRRQAPAPGRQGAVESGYYLRDAVIEGMDESGKRLYTLRAERIVEDPATANVVLEEVTLDYLADDGPPWVVVAAAGLIPAAGGSIALTGGVSMAEQLMPGAVPATVRTPQLDIDLVAHRAMTALAVEIERGNYRLTAIGMDADLKAQTLTLQSDVHGRFLP